MRVSAAETPELWAFLGSLRPGQTLSGTVAAIERFGVFVDVADGIEGLVHVRDLARTPVAAPEEVVQVGDPLTVTVVGIDRERRRLTLSAKADPDPDPDTDPGHGHGDCDGAAR